jgi:hypothetical protein
MEEMRELVKQTTDDNIKNKVKTLVWRSCPCPLPPSNRPGYNVENIL